MKTLKSAAIVLGLFVLLAGTTTTVKAQDDYYQGNYADGNNISLQTFYDELSPYGTWIQDPQYGYVWRPDVDQSDFRPYYSNGRWAMTEYGNTWVSNYDWGWAPFHYGRWVYNRYREWIWLPDTNWGPAWVDWRSGDGYYGWAPMAPSININLSFGRRYAVPDFCWNFIPQASIYINAFPRYDYGRNNVYIRNTTIINNTYVYNRRSYYGGPRIEDIRRATNRNVTVYRFDQSNRPGASRIDNRAVSIYRPRPERNAVDNRIAAPKRFEERNAGFDRNGRNNGGIANRDPRAGNNADRGANRTDNRVGQPDNNNRNNPNSDNRNNNNQPNTRGGSLDRNQGRPEQPNNDQRDRNVDRGGVFQGNQQRAQRDAQVQQQRSQQMEQQGAQRDAQVQQQRSQQEQQQRSQQMEQQRAQRDAQAQQQRSQQEQQQRSQQMEQQRAQRDAQAQQQRSQQEQQQRAQRDAQAQQQRSQQEQQQRSQQQQQRQQQNNNNAEGGRPSRGNRG